MASTHCDADSTFASIFGTLLSELPVVYQEKGMGFSPPVHRSQSSMRDLILRDSELKEGASKVPFRQSNKGKALNKVNPADATPLFELCPTALIFGMWGSTGPKGGLGPKFERAIVSEVVGIWCGD